MKNRTKAIGPFRVNELAHGSPHHRHCYPVSPIERLEPRTLFAVGSLDPGFGTNGQVTVQFTGGPALLAVRDTIAQADGKLLVVGTAADNAGGGSGGAGATDIAVARLNADGTPDATFGTGGVAVIPAAGNSDAGEDIDLLPDGRIVITGFFADGPVDAAPTTEQLFVARLTASGAIDTDFGGGDGIAVADFPSSAGGNSGLAEGQAIKVLADGKLLAGGTVASGTDSTGPTRVALFRFLADGAADTTFGADGVVVATPAGSNASETLADLMLQSDGRIVAVGGVGSQTTPQATFLARRFNADGSVDTSFGAGSGAATASFAGAANGTANSLTIQPDGKIVLGGFVVSGNLTSGNAADVIYNFGLARFDTRGRLDRRFGDGGIVLGSPDHINTGFNGYEVIQQIIPEDDGGLIVSGLHADDTGIADAGQVSPIIAGYEANGDPDAGFGTNGQMILAMAAGAGSPRAGGQSASPQALSPVFDPSPITVNQTAGEGFREIQRQQAAIVASLRDRLVLVGSAMGQVTATQLIGPGPDLLVLAPTGLKTHNVLGGSRATVSLPIMNDGNATSAGVATITLMLSTDQTLDGADATAATVQSNVRVKASATKMVRVKFTFPDNLPDGDYFLFATVTPAADQDTTDFNNSAFDPAAVTIAAPFVDLGGVFATPTGAAGASTPGRKGTLSVSLTNSGNIPARGRITFTAAASTDNVSGGVDDRALTVPRPVSVNLKPDQTRSVRVPITLPADLPPGTYFLVATFDASSLEDTNLTNNTLIGGQAVQVG